MRTSLDSSPSGLVAAHSRQEEQKRKQEEVRLAALAQEKARLNAGEAKKAAIIAAIEREHDAAKEAADEAALARTAARAHVVQLNRNRARLEAELKKSGRARGRRRRGRGGGHNERRGGGTGPPGRRGPVPHRAAAPVGGAARVGLRAGVPRPLKDRVLYL